MTERHNSIWLGKQDTLLEADRPIGCYGEYND